MIRISAGEGELFYSHFLSLSELYSLSHFLSWHSFPDTFSLSLKRFFGTLSAARNVLCRKKSEEGLAGRKRERQTFTLWERAGRLSPIKTKSRKGVRRELGWKKGEGKKVVCARRFSPSQQRRERAERAEQKEKSFPGLGCQCGKGCWRTNSRFWTGSSREKVKYSKNYIEISSAKKLVAEYLECEVETKKKQRKREKSVKWKISMQIKFVLCAGGLIGCKYYSRCR